MVLGLAISTPGLLTTKMKTTDFQIQNILRDNMLSNNNFQTKPDAQRLSELEELFEYYLEKENKESKQTEPRLEKKPEVSREVNTRCCPGRTPRVVMQVEALETFEEDIEVQPVKEDEQSESLYPNEVKAGQTSKKETKEVRPLLRSNLLEADKVGPQQESDRVQPYQEPPQVQTPKVSIRPHLRGVLATTPRVETIRHKLPNWAGFALALAILPILFFLLGRTTSSNRDDAGAYYNQVKEQVLGLAASPEPKATAKDYLLEAREAFKRAQEISKEKELSQEDKNKITNLINLAIQTLLEGIAKHPNEAALYFERAQIYKALTKSSPEAKTKIRQDLEKAYKLAPNAPNVLALYGRFLVEEGEIEKAKTIFDQLLTLLPQDSPDYQTVLSWRQQLEPTPTPTPIPTVTPTPTPTATPTPNQDTSEVKSSDTSEVEEEENPEESEEEIEAEVSDKEEVEPGEQPEEETV